jgi:NTP pyrophosphatase (non-canonical NTP hydrolase)
MHISEFQRLISDRYEQRDRQRGVPATFMWFIEEVGELATALSGKDELNKIEEFAMSSRGFARSRI